VTTKIDLRRMVLRHLTVIDATEDPDAEQAENADLYIDAARAMLLEKTVCWWDENDIPAAVTIPLSRYIAALACASFRPGRQGFRGLRGGRVPPDRGPEALGAARARPRRVQLTC
jgi:hypothetical protein